MTVNVGSWDRIARIVGGAALLGAMFSGMIGAWGWVGVVPLITALFGYCPIYLPFGFSSANKRRPDLR